MQLMKLLNIYMFLKTNFHLENNKNNDNKKELQQKNKVKQNVNNMKGMY